ncbi:hypothetical protein C9I56_02735 [Paraburkholderia caribensis]|nr:hypothetical protein C9I56_02735 [Paraburkholderia caribensis]
MRASQAHRQVPFDTHASAENTPMAYLLRYPPRGQWRLQRIPVFSGTLAMRAYRWGNGVPKRNVRGAFDPCDRAARVRFGTLFFAQPKSAHRRDPA